MQRPCKIKKVICAVSSACLAQFALLAQSVELLPLKEKVGGSNPSQGTIRQICGVNVAAPPAYRQAGLKAMVGGPNPSRRTLLR